MRDPLDWTAEELLAIPADEPGRLFTGDEPALRQQLQRLVSRWHPDRNAVPAAPAVFAAVQALYERAVADLREHRRRGPAVVQFDCSDGRSFQLRYLRRHEFELGEMFIAREHVAFRLAPEHQDLFDAGARCIESLPFADDGMRRQLQDALPRVTARLSTPLGPVLVVDKHPELVLLRDLLDSLGGKLDGRHVAWVLSRLHHLACYLEFARLSHNAIAADTFFVSPRLHTGALLGGWWYAAPAGARLRAVPQRTATVVPDALISARSANVEIDLELIQALGRELLGDAPTIGFLARPDIPKVLANALRLPAASDALTAYQQWQSVLTASFGKRKFVELAVSPNDVYKEF